MHDEISRDKDANKVVRPGFRMGLKPTALLRHTAKVRLAQGLAQNDTGRVFAKYFPFLTPSPSHSVCHLSRRARLRYHSFVCLPPGGSEAARLCLPPSGREGDRLRWKENAAVGIFKVATPKRFLHTQAPPATMWPSPLPEGGDLAVTSSALSLQRLLLRYRE